MDKIIATIEDVTITEKDLENVIKKYPEDKRVYFQKEKWRNRLIKEVIGNELLYCYSKELGLENDENFIKEIEIFKKELLIKMMLKKITSNIIVTESEVKKYYDENLEEFYLKENAAVRHILVENEVEALEIRESIEANKISFEDAAMKHSMCPSSLQGGFLGSVSRGLLYREIDNYIFNCEINKLSMPLKSEMGYHIVLVEDIQSGRQQTFTEVKNTLTDNMIKDKQRTKYDTCILDLESRFKVEKYY